MARTIPMKAFTSSTVTFFHPLKMDRLRSDIPPSLIWAYVLMLVTRYVQTVLVRNRKRYSSGGAVVAIAIFGPGVAQNGKLVGTVGKIPIEREVEEGKGRGYCSQNI